jgi:polyferredoxin
LCIDACNEVMNKFSLPPNLIHYSTVDNKKFKFLRPRSLYYLVISIFLIYIIIFGIFNKSKTGFIVDHLRNPLWVVMSNGDIRNSYKVIIENKTNLKKIYSFKVEGLKNYKISNREGLDLENIEINSGAYLDFVVHLISDSNNKEIFFEIVSKDDKILKKAFFYGNSTTDNY